MRLKEIKPGMVIHCKTKEEMEELSKHLKFFNTVDRIWNYGNDGVRRDCISINDMGQYKSFCTYDYFANEIGCKITEFSDLILPDLSAEEVFSIMSEIHNESYKKYSGCIGCCLSVVAQNCDTDCFAENADKIIEICAQWKSEHEKKEPEIEWVYRVFGAENYGEKFFQTEEEAIKRCEELAKSQKTKQYARYERVCRVKEV